MKKIFLFLCIFSISLFASSSVWKVSKNGNHIYIGGTIHILSKEDYPLAREFQIAYDDSKILVFEADLSKMNTLEAQKLLQVNSMYKEGKSLKNFLKKDTLDTLNNYLESKGLPSSVFLQLKPGLITTLITVRALQELGINELGVDAYFEQMAIKDKKQLLYLEKIEEQINFITSIGIGNEENFIKYTMSEMKNLPRDINIIRNAWKEGNVKVLETKFIDILEDRFPKIYEGLLVKRNNNWIPKIEKMFLSEDVEYVLFGSLHLAGKDGILHKLEKLGYKIEKL